MLHIEKVTQEITRNLAAHEIRFSVEWYEGGRGVTITAPEFEKVLKLKEPESEMLRGVVTMNARKWNRALHIERRFREEGQKPAGPNGAAPAAAFVEHNGEPRITDLALAEYLEWGIPRNIRAALIAPHREDLEAVAHLRSEPINTTGKGGRPGTKYFLTREQALLICALSRGEKARQARQRVIEVFYHLNAERRTPKPDPAHDKANDPAERLEAIEKRLLEIESTLQKVHGVGRTVIDGFGTHLDGLTDEVGQLTAAFHRMQRQIDRVTPSRSAEARPDGVTVADMRRNIRKAIALLERDIAD